MADEITEADLNRKQAMDDVESALRVLAANILRIIRGAGRPFDIMQQIAAFVRAVQEFEGVSGQIPSMDEVQRALDPFKNELDLRGVGDAAIIRQNGERQILRGALQIVASRLSYQSLPEKAGSKELYEGLQAIERARDEARKEWQARIVTNSAARAGLAVAKLRKRGSKTLQGK